MPTRSNPWPSFVDLYLALFVMTFAGLVILSASYKPGPGDRGGVTTWIDSVKNVVKNSLQLHLKNSNIKSRVGDCGDDICFDLYIHFDTDKDIIKYQNEIDDLQNLATDLKEVIDEMGDRKEAIEMNIEGHTDSQQPPSRLDEKILYLYNWNLSSRRALAVLYEFTQSGLSSPDYNIVAIGYADSRKLCPEETRECHEKNRRTTLRIRIDTKKLEELFKE